jgi:rRNA biogenesis protein RRP5
MGFFVFHQVISWYAAAEYDYGSIDRARVLMEELLASYPKRLDLWNIYIDKEIKLINNHKSSHASGNGSKQGTYSSRANLEFVRTLFDRLVHSKGLAKPRQMQTQFKKYLEFEVKFGDAASQQAVKTKAREYVDSFMKV